MLLLLQLPLQSKGLCVIINPLDATATCHNSATSLPLPPTAPCSTSQNIPQIIWYMQTQEQLVSAVFFFGIAKKMKELQHATCRMPHIFSKDTWLSALELQREDEEEGGVEGSPRRLLLLLPYFGCVDSFSCCSFVGARRGRWVWRGGGVAVLWQLSCSFFAAWLPIN